MQILRLVMRKNRTVSGPYTHITKANTVEAYLFRREDRRYRVAGTSPRRAAAGSPCGRRRRQCLLGCQGSTQLPQHLLLLLREALLRDQHVLQLAVVRLARLGQLRGQRARALAPEINFFTQATGNNGFKTAEDQQPQRPVTAINTCLTYLMKRSSC
jgi:hypothetical protein